MNDLANTLTERQNWDEGVKMHRDTLFFRMGILDSNNLEIGNSMNNLAISLRGLE